MRRSLVPPAAPPPAAAPPPPPCPARPPRPSVNVFPVVHAAAPGGAVATPVTQMPTLAPPQPPPPPPPAPPLPPLPPRAPPKPPASDGVVRAERGISPPAAPF